MLGLVAAWGLSRILATMLYAVEPRDVTTFTIVPLLMLAPASLAALQVSPSEVMRGD